MKGRRHSPEQVVRKLRELSPLYEMAQEGIDLSKVSWVND